MSLTSLNARLDGRVVATDLDRALQQLAEADQLRANAASLLGELDGTGLAEWLGYVSLDRLVAHRSSRGNAAARELMRIARHLAQFDATADAVRSGQVSFAAAEVLARAARDMADAYREYEDQLLDAAASHEVDELEQLCRLWRARANSEANAADAERVFNQRGLWMQFAFDGAGYGRFSLDATGAEAVWAALETPPDPVTQLPEPRTAAQRRADKLVDVCTMSTEGEPDQGSAGIRATVDVVIDIETLAANSYATDIGQPSQMNLDRMRAELSHGGPITGTGLDRLLCDASFRALITDGPRTVLAYNRATPAIPPGLRRAVRVRDRHCTFIGCDRPWWWCDLHHITPRNRGGPTTAENLTLLCRFHHGCVHDRGWQLTRARDGAIHVRSP
ncbi:MAG: DUF222 domain-containing protein [Acidimicrobiales bacterium]